MVRGRNAAISISFQNKNDFTRELNGNDLQGIDYTLDQEGRLGAITPAFALELTKTLGVGAAGYEEDFRQHRFLLSTVIYFGRRK